MKTSLCILLVLLFNLPTQVIAQDNTTSQRESVSSDYVVLLHGLSRHPSSMEKMQETFDAKGFITFNEGYPSRKLTIEMIVDSVLYPQMQNLPLKSNQKIHFVTHSLGGIIVRHLLEKYPDLPVGRVVMLSPPNKGSELVDTFRNVPILARTINGPAFFQLGTDKDSFVNQLGPVRFECGIIMGNQTWNAFYSTLIPGNDDGKVSVESAKVEGMKEFITLPSNHTFIMRNEEVIRQAAHFIEKGAFDKVES